MPTYVALLRGINVGGARSFKMADLKAAITDAGGADVATYIQSGNAVFDHANRSATKLQTELERAFARAAGFAVPVVLRTSDQIEKALAANPFPDADESHLHVTFFAGKVAATALRGLDRDAFAPEEAAMAGKELYLRLPNGMGRSKLAAKLARLLPDGTTRNWRTVTKLAAMADR